MNRDEWNKIYAERIQEITGCSESFATMLANEATDEFKDDTEPVYAADEELSYWDADE